MTTRTEPEGLTTELLRRFFIASLALGIVPISEALNVGRFLTLSPYASEVSIGMACLALNFTIAMPANITTMAISSRTPNGSR